MKKYFVGMFAVASLLLCHAQLVEANLITNGDFEEGNVGFSTDYTYYEADLSVEGGYVIGSNPYDYRSDIMSYGDHTSGFGDMMIVNGSTTSNAIVWEQTVAVSQDTDYLFSIWLSHWSPYMHNLEEIEVFINDVSIGSSVPTEAGQWRNFSQTWQSSSSTAANIKIIDMQTAVSTNDFAMDDISLTPIPEPSTTILLAIATLSLITFTWRKRK